MCKFKCKTNLLLNKCLNLMAHTDVRGCMIKIPECSLIMS